MFEKLSCKIADKLEESETISDSNRELYEYGLRQMFTTLLNILTTLIIGFAMGMIIQSIVFTLAYIPIRIYAGGFHASTPQRCWAISAVMLIAALCFVKYLPEAYYTPLYAISIIACIIIMILSPVEDLNKPLDEKEKTVYKRRAIIITVIEAAIAVVLCLLNAYDIMITTETVWIVLSIMLIIGKLKNYTSVT
jgi:accessory gene regulator B